MATSASSDICGRPSYSCVRCSNRKVKCDRQRPCSACVKHKVECVFNPSQPPQQKRKRVKSQVLIDRLRHYEGLLKDRGIDPGELPDTPDAELSPSMSKTQLVYDQGRSKFINK